MTKRLGRLPSIYRAVVVIILYEPIFYLIYYSFNSAGNMHSFEGFTLDWYREVLQDTRLFIILLNTLVIALLSSALSTVLGVFGALAIKGVKLAFRTRSLP